MKTLLVKAALGVGLLASVSAYAQAPAGATAECKDGTYYSGTTHKGACRGHQGVKSWLDASSAASTGTAANTSTGAAANTSTSKKTKKAKAAAAEPAASTAATSTASASGTHTAMCKDGTYYDGASHKGACRGHKGVQEWLDTKPAAASKTAAATSAAAAPTPTPAPTPAPAAAPSAAPKAAATEHKAPTPASEITQKAGGGPGLVWVNSESKVYHCQGDEWYGKTKQGSYMSESAAKAEGDHAARGKECSK
jgi:hypothetical protein